MKNKLILMIFLLQLSFATFAQNTCQTSLPINSGIQTYTFTNSNDLWLTFAADTFNYGFAIYPDTNFLFSNIREINIYYGDCNNLAFVRNIHITTQDTIYVFLDSLTNDSYYKINIQNIDTVSTGFAFEFHSVTLPKAVASGSTICNILQNSEFYTNGNGNLQEAFADGLVPFWDNLFGTPSISNYSILQNPGGNATFLWSQQSPTEVKTEAISQLFVPISTNTNDYYRLSFRYAIPSVNNPSSALPLMESLRFYLLNSTQFSYSQALGSASNQVILSYFDQLVQNNIAQEISFGSYTYPVPPSLTWQDQSLVFQISGAPASNQYDYIIIFPVAAPNDVKVGINIDDVKLTKMDIGVTAASTSPFYCPNSSNPVILSAISNSSNPPITFTWEPGGLIGSTVQVSPSTTTTYTVTAVDNLGCWGIDVITIETPFEHLSINNPAIHCNANSTLIQILGAPLGSTFNWNGFGSSNSNISDPITTTGTYTVIVSYNGCDVTLTSNVTNASPSPKPLLDKFVNNLCDIDANNVIQYDILQPVNGTYLWELYESNGTTFSNAGSLQSSTGTSNLITWDLNSFPYLPDYVIIRITLTDENNCVSVNEFKIFRCCEHPDPPAPFMQLDNTSTSALNMQSNYSGTYFMINGDFIIDQDITFTSCTFYMGPESKIKILRNDATFKNNELSAKFCYHMWNGIESEENEGVIRDFGANTIKDAYNAIKLTGDINNSANPDIDIYSNEFINNNKGIVLNNFSNKPSTSYEIYKNAFYSSNSAIMQYGTTTDPNITFLPPLDQPYNRPYSGISVTYCNSMNIGRSINILDKNSFSFLFSGIRCVNSDVKVINNVFRDIHEVFDPNGLPIFHDIRGMAIYSARTTNFSANFSQQGIIAGGSLADANYGALVDIGIYTKNDKHFTISYNYFNSVKHGIYALGLQTFKITTKFITKNTFTNISRNGIYLKSLSGVVVYDNIINQILPPPNSSPYSKVFGIRALACNASLIEKNNIYNSNTTSDIRIIGISDETGPNTIKINDLKNLGNAAYFNGNCLPSTYSCNSMTSDYYGLYLNNSTIGQQGGNHNPSCNKWYGLFSTQCQTFLDAGTSIPGNPYYCHNNIIEYPTITCPTSASLERHTTTGICAFCIDDYYDPVINVGTLAFPPKSSIMWILQDSVQYPTSDEKQFWLGKFNLYSLLRVADQDSLSTEMLDFMANYDTNNVRIFTIAELIDSGAYQEARNLISATTALSDASGVLLHVYDIICESALAGDFSYDEPLYTPEELSMLRDYAVLCPNEYGYGVYLARNLLSRIEPAVYYNNCDNIIDMRHMVKPSKSNDIKVTVYPNPAKDDFTVEFTGDISGQPVTIELFDLFGSPVKTMIVDNQNQIEISTSSLSAGIYFYRVKVNQNTLDENKLVIIK